MQAPPSPFASGAWLTLERIRRICVVLVSVYGLGFAALYATSNGRLDAFDRPLGTDFSEVWVAGLFVNEGHPEKPYDNAAHAQRQREAFSATSGFFAWSYPPYFLAIASLTALLPYALALLLWQAASLPLYLAAVLARLPRRPEVWLAALAYPAVFVNLGHGHNGFLSAGLMGLGFLLLERRPVAAGLLLSLLAFKPQFALVVPIALAAGGHWRSFAAAALGLAAITMASYFAYGAETWRAFFASTAFAREVILEQGSTGWEKIQSVFSAVRMWGGGIGLAYAAQGAVSVAALGAVALLWRRPADERLKIAAAMTAAVLATPYCLDYDLTLLGPALALAAAHGLERGFGPYEKSGLALVWAMPLAARGIAGLTLVPLGALTMIGFFAWLVWRGSREIAAGGRIG